MAIFTNQATLSYSGGVVTSNVATGEIVDVLSANKTAVVDDYAQGSEITYAVNVINSGDIPMAAVTLTDDLGAYPFGTGTLQPLDYVDGSVKVFIDGVLQPTPTVTAVPALSIGPISVPANGVTTVLYTARTNSFAPVQAGGDITNTVTVSSGTTTATASETVAAQTAPNLSIDKSVSPVTVNENGTLTYTFVIQNSGNEAADATDNVVITDVFDPILNNITVTYNGEPWAEPANYAYDEQTGVFQTVAGGITVPAATFEQDAITGQWTVTPGTATLTVTGTL